jgi:hypothetical protein
LQKTAQDPVKEVQAATPPRIASPQRPRAKGTPIKKHGSAVPRSSSKLVKSKIPHPQKDIRQSASPPPSSSFQGLHYAKSSSRAGKGKKEETEPMYSAVPSTEGAVPPMPKLPSKVRLPSGEIVHTSTASSSSSVGRRSGARQVDVQQTENEIMELEQIIANQQDLLPTIKNPTLKERLGASIQKNGVELKAKKTSIGMGDGAGNGKLQKARQQSEKGVKGAMGREDSFEWDKDVF